MSSGTTLPEEAKGDLGLVIEEVRRAGLEGTFTEYFFFISKLEKYDIDKNLGDFKYLGKVYKALISSIEFFSSKPTVGKSYFVFVGNDAEGKSYNCAFQTKEDAGFDGLSVKDTTLELTSTEKGIKITAEKEGLIIKSKSDIKTTSEAEITITSSGGGIDITKLDSYLKEIKDVVKANNKAILDYIKALNLAIKASVCGKPGDALVYVEPTNPLKLTEIKGDYK